MTTKQEVPSITAYIYAKGLILLLYMCGIQRRHLFYNSTIQYSRQTESAINCN